MPGEVLAQLGCRVQHALRAFPPGRAGAGRRAGRGGKEPGRGAVAEVLGSSMFRSFARSAASAAGREISRSLLGTASVGSSPLTPDVCRAGTWAKHGGRSTETRAA